MTRNDRQVPPGWRVVRLGDVAEVVMGQSPPGETVIDWTVDFGDDDGLPFIQGNAEFGVKSPEPVKWCVRPLKVAYPDDVLISVRAPVGQTNRADGEICIGRGLTAIRFNQASKAFGWHIVNHSKGALERVTQGSTFQAIGGESLRSLPIALPPLSEQRAIAAVLDSIDGAIERTEAVITATERLRDSLLHDLLTRGVPGWHTEWKEVPGIGTMSADWEVVRLGDVAEVVTGGTPSRNVSDYFGGSVPWLKPSDLISSRLVETSEEYLSPTGASISRPVPSETILVSCIGTIGEVAIAKVPLCFNQHN